MTLEGDGYIISEMGDENIKASLQCVMDGVLEKEHLNAEDVTVIKVFGYNGKPHSVWVECVDRFNGRTEGTMLYIVDREPTGYPFATLGALYSIFDFISGNDLGHHFLLKNPTFKGLYDN